MTNSAYTEFERFFCVKIASEVFKMNFYDLLMSQAKIFRSKTFLQVDNQKISYFDFLNTVSSSKFHSQAKNFIISNRESVFEVKTSGSTSNPKILRRTFESWADFFPIQNKIFRVDENSKVFMHGDLNFTGNLNTLLAILFAGGSIVTTDKFSPKKWLELIKSATNIYLVPAKLNLIANGEPIYNIKSIFTGSQALNAAQSLSLIKKFPNAEIFMYYGASELSFVTYKKITAENAADVQNLGKPFDGVKIFIREGKIYVDTPFRAENIPNPATVGDFGRIEDGNLIFLGRGEDFINRGGVKVFASAIEQKISALEGVEAVAVVKIADKLRGENFLAYVVGNLDKKIIRQALLPAELPRDIIFVKDLPLNASGKVDKKILAQTSQILQ